MPTKEEQEGQSGIGASPADTDARMVAAAAAATKTPLQFAIANKVDIKLYNAGLASNPSGDAGSSTDRGLNDPMTLWVPPLTLAVRETVWTKC